MKEVILKILYLSVLFYCCLALHGQSKEVGEIIDIGNHHFFNKEIDIARNYYDSAMIIAQETGDSIGECLSKYRIGYTHISQEEDFIALAYFTEALMQFSPKSKEDSVFYYLLNLEEQNITKEIIYSNIEPEYLYGFLNSCENIDILIKRRFIYLLGSTFYERFNYKDAEKYYKIASNIKTPDRYLDERCWFLLAYTYYMISDFSRSYEYYELILSSDILFLDYGKVYYFVAYSLYHSGFIDEAALNAQRALLLSSAPDIITETTYLLACIELESERYSEALSLFRKSLTLAKKMSNPEHIGTIYLAIGEYYKKVGQTDSSRHYYTIALNYAIENELHINIRSQIASLMAGSYFINEEYELVIQTANEFLLEINNSEENFDSDFVSKFYHELLSLKVKAYYRLWENDKSDTTMLLNAKEAIIFLKDKVSESYNKLTHDDSKYAFQSRIRDNTELAFKIFYSLNEIHNGKCFNELLNIVELGKAIGFKFNMSRSDLLSRAGIQQELINKETETSKRISLLRNYLLESAQSIDDSLENELRIELAQLNSTYDSISDVLAKRVEGYDKLHLKWEVSDFSEIIESVDSNQLVLDYFIVHNKLYTIYFNKYSRGVIEVDIDSTFGENIMQLREGIQKHPLEDFKNQGHYAFCGNAFELYGKLIKPVDSIICRKRLVIVPDKEINLVPFDILVADTVGISHLPLSQIKYLIKSNPLTTLNTITQLEEKPVIIDNYSTYIGFAPQYSSSNPRCVERGLMELPGSVHEVESINDYLKGEVYVRNRATKHNFMSKAWKADIVHLALHTIISEQDPMNSSLVFYNETGDGLNDLFTYELHGTKFNAGLMVLSGCNTGAGKILKGEGLMNLARGFFYTGIRNVIVTQWAVADKSCSELMNHFYRNLSEGKSVDVALQRAKLDFINFEDPLWHHPYYWAGYNSLGNPVVYKANNKNLLWGVSLSLILFIFMIWKRTRP